VLFRNWIVQKYQNIFFFHVTIGNKRLSQAFFQHRDQNSTKIKLKHFSSKTQALKKNQQGQIVQTNSLAVSRMRDARTQSF